MKFNFRRTLNVAALIISLAAIVLLLQKPTSVAHPQNAAALAEHAQSFDQKMADFQQATNQPVVTGTSSTSDASKPEVHINSDEASAVLAQSLGNAEPKPSLENGGAPTIKDQQVSFEGDVVHGQFLTQIAGKDVWITISGHLGEKDGFATFDPTEFKVGDLSVPVSLVNPALQKKLAEQRDRMKLPDNVGGLRIENGELVMQGK